MVVFYVALLLLGILSGATAAVVGFGIGSLLTPLLLTRFEPHVAIALVSIPHLLATALRYVQHRRFIDRQVLLRFGVPSAIGSLIGALLQQRMSAPLLIIALAVLLLATGVANLTSGFRNWQPGSRTAGVLGFLSGLFGGIAGNQGGLRAAGLTAFQLEPRAFLATSTAVALWIDLARTPLYLARGHAALRQLIVPIAVATAGCLAGTVMGERIILRMSTLTYRKVVGTAVLILGLYLLWRAR